MRIQLIAVGERLAPWVNQGFEDYRKRLSGECRLQLIEISAERRGRNHDTARILEKEGQRMSAALPRNAYLVALERSGNAWSTLDLSKRLAAWLQQGRDLALLVGGPEGLAPPLLQQADECWSLSALTFPHPLVRIVVAEQLYRAYSILKNHPYHK